MYELSYGNNSQKTRFDFIPIAIFAISSFIFFTASHKYAYALWFIGMFIALFIHNHNERKPGNEPKTENTHKIVATYGLDRAQLLCMLRNAQLKKNI